MSIPSGAPEKEQHIFRVLEYMKLEGFPSLLPFLEAVFNSKDHAIKSRVGRFYANGGFATMVKAMAGHARFKPENRVTKESTNELKHYVGDEVIDICLRIFRQVRSLQTEQRPAETTAIIIHPQELKDITRNNAMQLSPANMTPEIAEQFEMNGCTRKLKEDAPYLNRMLQSLCGVPEVKRVDGTEELFVDSSTPQNEHEDMDLDSMSDNEELECQAEAEWNPKPVKQRRNKALMSTLVAHIMMFARSQRDNYLQTILGFWLQSVKAPKRLIALLNRLGISVSYSSVTAAIKAVGAAAHRNIQVNTHATEW
jgi:hypothetical protein